jgi:hypothetical protein
MSACYKCNKFRTPDIIPVAKRLGIYKSDNLSDWYVGYSPRNANNYDEGTWADWVALARVIIAIDDDRGGNELCKCPSIGTPVD